ncbi:MAG: hypothetical protein LBL01_02065, partial [Bifidobacteriaceae bacterium]|nr:hypothetical protein [Bifidobacteriaceae bacterium]
MAGGPRRRAGGRPKPVNAAGEPPRRRAGGRPKPVEDAHDGPEPPSGPMMPSLAWGSGRKERDRPGAGRLDAGSGTADE